MENQNRGLSTKEAAQYIGLSEATLRLGPMNGPRTSRCPVPPYVKLGRKIIYLKDDLDAYLERFRQIDRGKDE